MADFDGNGTLDLALASNDAKTGRHSLLRNTSPQRGRLLAISVVNAAGRMTLPGAEVRVYVRGTRTPFSSGLVDSGGGYCAQNLMPVFLAAPPRGTVDIEVTTITRGGRQVTRVRNIDPARLKGRSLTVKTVR